MLSARLLARCQSARPLTTGFITGFRLSFSQVGQDGSGKATLEQCENSTLYGVIFAMSATDILLLDEIEGPGYRRIRQSVFSNTSNCSVCEVYIGIEYSGNIVPFDWYLSLLIAGAKEHHLSEEHIFKLSSTPTVPDPMLFRPARRHAIRLLARAKNTRQ